MDEKYNVPVPVDDFKYYVRRDQDMNRIEKLIHKAKESSHEMIDVNELLILFE